MVQHFLEDLLRVVGIERRVIHCAILRRHADIAELVVDSLQEVFELVRRIRAADIIDGQLL